MVEEFPHRLLVRWHGDEHERIYDLPHHCSEYRFRTEGEREAFLSGIKWAIDYTDFTLMEDVPAAQVVVSFIGADTRRIHS